MSESLQAIWRYIEMRRAKPFKGLDDVIHGVHTGTEWEAELRLSDLEAVVLAIPPSPLDMLLFCPKCGKQHIDDYEETLVWTGGATPEPSHSEVTWENPPHRSHLCHGCGCIWRPADVPTNGVRSIATAGKADTWEPDDGVRQSPSPSDVERVADALRDDPFPDDIRLLGTTQHDQRCEHYARAALSAMPNPKGGVLERALRFYAEPNNWSVDGSFLPASPLSDRRPDVGDTARQALADYPDDISTGQGEES